MSKAVVKRPISRRHAPTVPVPPAIVKAKGSRSKTSSKPVVAKAAVKAVKAAVDKLPVYQTPPSTLVYEALSF